MESYQREINTVHEAKSHIQAKKQKVSFMEEPSPKNVALKLELTGMREVVCDSTSADSSQKPQDGSFISDTKIIAGAKDNATGATRYSLWNDQ